MAGSFLLVEELFERGDPGFERELWRCEGRQLLPFCLRWSRDQRAFARQALKRVAIDPPTNGSDRYVVKVLFKAAERRADDELMAHFMVGFDRGVRREPVLVESWDWRRRELVGHWVRQVRGDRSEDDFSLRTQAYLMRRAWRYFRRIGPREPERYLAAITQALTLYDDAHLPKPDSVLDTMSLCRILFRHSPALRVHPRQMFVEGDLGGLEPAPAFPKTWQSQAGFDALLSVLRQGKSAFVRAWAARYLGQEHDERLARMSLDELLPLLGSPHDEAQRFAAERLEALDGWGRLVVTDWLKLLAIDNPHATGPLAKLVKQHVLPERLSRDQCMELAQSPVSEFALLGMRWLRDKGIGSEAELARAATLTEAELPVVRKEVVEWLRPKLVERHRSLLLRDWVDSRHSEVRSAALEVLNEVAHYQDDLRLHAAMAETPYGDVLDVFVQRLESWQKSLDAQDLRHVWATALLAVRRGSRTKKRALELLSRAVQKDPEKAPDLLPLVGVLLRSVRKAERRSALAAIARAVFENPDLRPHVHSALPELTLWEAQA